MTELKGTTPNDLIEELSKLGDKIKDPQVQYEVRYHYVGIVRMCLADNICWPIYDFWRALLPYKDLVGRGFWLDLWDILNSEIDTIKIKQSEITNNQRDSLDQISTLVTAFVCGIIRDFAEILRRRTVPGMPVWINAVVSNLRRATSSRSPTGDTPSSDLDCRSLMRLTNSLYPTASNEWLKILEEQHNCFCQRIAFKKANLISSSIFRKSPDDNTPPQDDEILMAKIFIVINELILKDGNADLERLASDISNRMETTDNMKSFVALVKYWGSENMFFRRLLRDKLKFEYTNLNSPQVRKRHTLVTSLTQQVMIIGPRDVGKSSLLMATRELSRKWVNQQEQKDINKPLLQLFRKNEAIEAKEIDELENRWKRGEKVVTEGWEIYAETPTIDLCRYSFYDIPGEQVEGDGDDLIEPTILGQQLKMKIPAALIIMQNPNNKSDVNTKIFDLLARAAIDTTDERAVKDIPIYFLFNKADKLLPYSDANDESTVSIFNKSLLQGPQVAESDDVNERTSTAMFTLRNYDEYIHPNSNYNINHILEIVCNSDIYCSDPVFQNRLSQDIRMIQPLVEKALEKQFFNLIFGYTVCIQTEDVKDGEKAPSDIFTGLKNVWDDLRLQVTASTYDGRKKSIKVAFIDDLETHAKYVEEFRNSCLFTDLKLSSAGKTLDNALQNLDNSVLEVFSQVKNSNKQIRNSNDLLSACRSIKNEHVRKVVEELEEREKYVKQIILRLEIATKEILKQLGIPSDKKFSEIHDLATQFSVDKGDTDPGLIQIELTKKRSVLQKPINDREGIHQGDELMHKLESFLEAEGDSDICIKEFTDAIINYIRERCVHHKHRPFRYHHLIGALDTGCKWRDEDHTDIKNDVVSYMRSNNDRQILECFLNQFNKDELTNDDFIHSIATLIANYDPLYPQFTYRFFEVDKTKYRVLTDDREAGFRYNDFLESQTHLYNMITIVHKIFHSINSCEEKYLSARVMSRLMFKTLRQLQFRVDEFQKNDTSEMFLLNINKIANLLERTNNDNIEVINGLISQISLSGDSLDAGSTENKRLELMLKYQSAAEAFRTLKTFMQDGMIEPISIEKYVITELSFESDIEDFKILVNKYTSDLTKMLIKERAQYLLESGWLEGIDQHLTKFAREALQMSIDLESNDREFAQSLKGIRSRFTSGVERLVNEANWGA